MTAVCSTTQCPSQHCEGMPGYMLLSEVCLPCSLQGLFKYLLRVELVNDYLDKDL